MKNTQKPYVIAIAAVSGGGKTTITKHLNDKLVNSKALYFDTYEIDGPEDICEWVENGSHHEEWNLTPLIIDLQSLLSDHNSQLDFILLDYPFACSHNEMSKFIDFTVFIDTPLDIALARRILRDFTDESIVDVKNDVENYLSRGRFAYLEALRTTKHNSDFIVDGSLALEIIIDQIMEEIKKRINLVTKGEDIVNFEQVKSGDNLMNLKEEIQLIPIKMEAKNILENLMSMYLHDLSEFADDLIANKDGMFEYDGLNLYFTKEELKPFFIYLNDDIIGFILFNTGKYVPQNTDFSVHEIFILKSFRRRGISAIAVKKLFDIYSGNYIIEQLVDNKQAVFFWKSIYKMYGIECVSTIETIDELECYTQVFNI